MKKDAVASWWFSSVKTKGTPKRVITTALVGEMVNELLTIPVLLLVFEWGFVISLMCSWKHSHCLQHIQRHTRTYTSTQGMSELNEKRQQWDSMSFPVLNMTFEPNVYWFFWQVWEAKGRIKHQLETVRHNKSISRRFLMMPFPAKCTAFYGLLKNLFITYFMSSYTMHEHFTR